MEKYNVIVPSRVIEPIKALGIDYIVNVKLSPDSAVG